MTKRQLMTAIGDYNVAWGVTQKVQGISLPMFKRHLKTARPELRHQYVVCEFVNQARLYIIYLTGINKALKSIVR